MSAFREAIAEAAGLIVRADADFLEIVALSAQVTGLAVLIACAIGLETGTSRLPTIEGQVPPPLQFPPGCRFAPRCPHAAAQCAQSVPGLQPIGPQHVAACLRLDQMTKLEVAS